MNAIDGRDGGDPGGILPCRRAPSPRDRESGVTSPCAAISRFDWRRVATARSMRGPQPDDLGLGCGEDVVSGRTRNRSADGPGEEAAAENLLRRERLEMREVVARVLELDESVPECPARPGA